MKALMSSSDSEKLANAFLDPIREIGDIVMFTARAVRTITGIPRSTRLIIEAMLEIGVRSLPIVFVISIFVGATTAWQANYQLKGLVTTRFIGTAVIKSIMLELSPVLTGLVVAGRIGASIAASLGAMRVTEQIDALSSMAIDPVRYLVLPRVAAALVMVPMLTVYSVFFGLVGSMYVSVHLLDVPSGIFIYGFKRFFHYHDVVVCLVKSFVFGSGLSILGCYYGFNAEGGADGVGRAAIRAYVSSAVFILLSDFVIASIAF
jgi:phospholipid/cholesterol/gamma-HCH transport system permease protein